MLELNRLFRNKAPGIVRRKIALACLASAGFGMNAHAASVAYYLDQSNINSLPDGANYLQVTISDGASGAIDFRIDILQPLLNIAGAGFGLDSFGFDTSGAANSATASNITNLPLAWSVLTDKNQDGFGKFELIAQTNGSGNRVSPILTFSVVGVSGDTVYDYQVLSGGNAGQGNQFFAAHVAGFNASGDTSAYFGGSTPASVPLPAAVWLLSSGLVGLAGLSRRRGLSN